MPAERVSMRQIREVLRLRFASKLPQRAIAKSLGLSQGGGERLSQPGPRRRGELSPLAILQEIGFALDSLLEGDGFEPSVPRRGQHFFETTAEPATEKPARLPEPDFDDRQGQVLPSAEPGPPRQ